MTSPSVEGAVLTFTEPWHTATPILTTGSLSAAGACSGTSAVSATAVVSAEDTEVSAEVFACSNIFDNARFAPATTKWLPLCEEICDLLSVTFALAVTLDAPARGAAVADNEAAPISTPAASV